MTVAKEELHRLVDALPESATETVRRFLAWILDEEAATDLEPLTEREWAHVRRGEEQLTTGDYVRLQDLEAELKRGV